MRKYLKELPNKSRGHRKRFALLASGGFTLLVFVIWSAVKFDRVPEVADTTGPVNLAAVSEAAPPFETIFSGIKSYWQALTNLKGK
jgi:hypothetical protein